MRTKTPSTRQCLRNRTHQVHLAATVTSHSYGNLCSTRVTRVPPLRLITLPIHLRSSNRQQHHRRRRSAHSQLNLSRLKRSNLNKLSTIRVIAMRAAQVIQHCLNQHLSKKSNFKQLCSCFNL